MPATAVTLNDLQGHSAVVGFLFKCDYVTFGSLLSQIRMASVCLSVCNVGASYTQVVEAFGKLSSPLCTLTLQNFTEVVLGISSAECVKRKRGIKIERFWTYRRLYLINGTR